MHLLVSQPRENFFQKEERSEKEIIQLVYYGQVFTWIWKMRQYIKNIQSQDIW